MTSHVLAKAVSTRTQVNNVVTCQQHVPSLKLFRKFNQHGNNARLELDFSGNIWTHRKDELECTRLAVPKYF